MEKVTKRFPYVDTLSFLDTKSKTLSNRASEDDYILQCTDGTHIYMDSDTLENNC